MVNFIDYFIGRLPEIGTLLVQHLKISGMAVCLSILVGIPVGILITKNEKVARIVLGIAGIFQTIPSLALFGLIIPFLGIGVKPAIFVLFLYSLLPIVTNTYIGLKNVDQSTIQAAIGMGMTNFQVLTRVKLPIAISVIMGGIRISAVANIGTTTIAALIGAGGLGELIFRGISTSNNMLVLSGAIPTALLAFTVNYLLGAVEKVLTPTGMLENRGDKLKSKKVLKVAFVFIAIILSTNLYRKINTKNYPTIVVGHKSYTEQRIIGNMIGVLLEKNTDYKAKLTELGGTNINFEALKSNEIDLYPEYTGTAYSAILGQKGITDPKLVFDFIKTNYNQKYRLDILKPMGFENTYALVVTKEFSEKYGIRKISDLEKYKDKFKISGSHEFMERDDGIKGLNKYYNLKFKSMNSMDPGLIINSLSSDKIDIGVAFSTDGLIAKHKLLVLEDDRSFFPPYELTITVGENFEKKYPQLKIELEKLSGMVSNSDMQKLNLEAIEGNKSEKEIAQSYLEEKQLIKK